MRPRAPAAQLRVADGRLVAPDASGDVNDTMDILITAGEFQDLDIRASVCTSSACGGAANLTDEPLPTEGSRVDVVIPPAH